MVEPRKGSWENEIVTADALNTTTLGSGSTSERNDITTWPTDRLFLDTDLNTLYLNTGTESSPVWRLLNDFKFGDGRDGVRTISSTITLRQQVKQYIKLTVDANHTLQSDKSRLIIFAQDEIVINGHVKMDGNGAAGGAGNLSGESGSGENGTDGTGDGGGGGGGGSSGSTPATRGRRRRLWRRGWRWWYCHH